MAPPSDIPEDCLMAIRRDIAVLEQLNEEMRQELEALARELVELEIIFGDLTARSEVIEKDLQRILEIMGNVYRESAGSQA